MELITWPDENVTKFCNQKLIGSLHQTTIFSSTIFIPPSLIAAISYVLSELVPRYGFIKASLQLHHTFLFNLLRQPMSFFDQTPIGRILARFSKDIDIVDDRLPHNFDSLTFFTFQVNCVLTVTRKINLYVNSTSSSNFRTKKLI